MEIYPDGRIAFHSLLLNENGPMRFVQYDLDGKVKYEEPYKSYSQFEPKYMGKDSITINGIEYIPNPNH
jgi:hypothetical protein